MNKFPWGKVIKTFTYDFDGEEVKIVKYYPFKYANPSIKEIDYSRVEYQCDAIGQSASTLKGILLAWIVHRQLGWNQGALMTGLERMLKLEGDE